MLEDQGAMGREIDSPPGVVVIEQPAGAPVGQRLPPWQRATGSVRVGDFPGSVRLYNLLPGSRQRRQPIVTPNEGSHFRTRVLQSVYTSQFALLHAASQDDETRSDSVAASDKPQVVQPADKARAIETVVAHIEKQFGKGAIMRLGEASRRMTVETIPTGSIGLDIALGVGGVPRGRIVEIAVARQARHLYVQRGVVSVQVAGASVVNMKAVQVHPIDARRIHRACV